MANLVSPGINVSEISQTTVVPSVLTTAGAIAGNFNWGPASQLTLVDSEITLVNQFGAPSDNAYHSFFTSANFLAYGNNLSVVRAVGTGTLNADANTSQANIQITNSLQYDDLYPQPENLIGFYKFDEIKGTQVLDSSTASTYLDNSGNPVYINTNGILVNFDIENCWQPGIINNSLLYVRLTLA